MKTTKKGLIALAILLLGFVGFVFLQPDETTVERSLHMDAAPEQIYPLIYHLPNWEKWSTWKLSDPTMVNEYSEQKSGVGAYYTWTSENSGSGKLEITDATVNESMKTSLNFDGQGQGRGYWKLVPDESGTTVTWGFVSDADGSLMGKFFNLLMDSMLGSSLEDGLANISKLAAEAPTASPAPAPAAQDSTDMPTDSTTVADTVSGGTE